MSGMSLKDQIAILEDRLKELTSDDGGPQDVNEYNQVFNRLSELKHQLDQQEQEKTERVQAHIERIQQSAEEMAYALDGLEVAGLSMKDMCVGDMEYRMLKLAVQELINSKATKLSEQIIKIQEESSEQARAAEEREMNLKLQNTKLQQLVDMSESKIRELENDLYNEKELRKDAEQKRDNAVTELEGLRLVIAEKDKQIDTLRTEMAVGARNAYKVLDAEEQTKQLKELAEQIKASRVAIYNKRQLNANTYAANLASNGEEITFNWTTEKKYYEIDESEVEQFRQTQSAATYLPLDNGSAIQFPALEIPVIDTQPESQFQTDGPQLDQTDTGLEVAGKTLEERVAELEKRMAAVEENTTFGAVA